MLLCFFKFLNAVEEGKGEILSVRGKLVCENVRQKFDSQMVESVGSVRFLSPLS